LDLADFQELVPRLRQALQEMQHEELEEWFSRNLDASGVFDMKQLAPCLEHFGSMNPTGKDEWAEVVNIFKPFTKRYGHPGEGITRASELRPALTREQTREQGVHGKRVTISPIRATERTNTKGSILLPQGPSANVNIEGRFELFEALFHKAQERLTVMRRNRERELADRLHLTDDQLTEFRADLLELYEQFRKCDEDASGLLEEKEVMQLLASSGMAIASQYRSAELIHQAKARAAAHKNAEEMPKPVDRDLSLEVKVSKPLPTRDKEIEKPQNVNMQVDFVEFLFLMRILREHQRQAKMEGLRKIYDRYDYRKNGLIPISDMSRLFRDLKMEPRTKQQQDEIRKIFDEVDENGDGAFAFSEFVVLIQRVQERLERHARKEEEAYAETIGLPLARCRELRRTFQDCLKVGCTELDITDMRLAMDALRRRYTSSELVALFEEFGSLGSDGQLCLNAKGFLRMMCAIEIERTHGQLELDSVKLRELRNSSKQSIVSSTGFTRQSSKNVSSPGIARISTRPLMDPIALPADSAPQLV